MNAILCFFFLNPSSAQFDLSRHLQLNTNHRPVRNVLPGKHDVGVGVTRAGTCRAPLDGVDFFTVSLEVVNAGLLLHTPNL